jgi:hypothetical protein
MIRIRSLALALTFAAAGSGVAAAQDALVLITDSEVADSEPELEASELQNRMIWIGNAEGQTMSSKMLRLDLDDDDLALHPTAGYGTYLGYTEPAEFMKLLNRTITSGTLKDETVRHLRERGASAVKPIIVTILAEADLDGDGRSDTLLEAHTDHPADEFGGEAGDAEALLVADSSQHITASLINLASPNKAEGARTIFLVGGVAKNPFTGTWDMLVQQERKYWGEPVQMSVTINGEKMEGPDRAFITVTATDVYRYAGDALVRSDHLGRVSQSFCDEPPCE